MRTELVYIQYLRAFAALLVVMHHSLTHFTGIESTFLRGFGEYGVDIFFVISGFIMVYSTYSKNYSPGYFILRRLERIAPLYWFFTTALICIVIIKPDLFTTVKLNLWHTVASYAFIPAKSLSETFQGTFMPVLYVGWTLNYEMFFYLVFAISLFFADKYRLAFVGLILSSLVIFGEAFKPEGMISFYTNMILLEFFLGMVLGYLFVHGKIQANIALGLTGILLSIVIYALLYKEGLHRFFYGGLSATALVLGAIYLSSTNVYRNKVFSLLGDASYSIYLSHFFSIGLTSFVRSYFGLNNVTDMNLITIFIITNIIFSSIVGIVVYKLIEEPINLKLRKKRH